LNAEDVVSEPDSHDDIGDIFEALCAGQSEAQVVDDLLSKGWSRDAATDLVRSLEGKVTEFLAAESDLDVPETPPPEEPMKSFRLHRGKPIEELGEIAGKLAGWLVGFGIMALLMYSCSKK
jgi:hypothetical protein